MLFLLYLIVVSFRVEPNGIFNYSENSNKLQNQVNYRYTGANNPFDFDLPPSTNSLDSNIFSQNLDDLSADTQMFFFKRIRFRFPKTQRTLHAIELNANGKLTIQDSKFTQTSNKILKKPFCGFFSNYIHDVDPVEGSPNYLIQLNVPSLTLLNTTISYLDSDDLNGALKLVGNGQHVISQCTFINTNSTGAICYAAENSLSDDYFYINNCLFHKCFGSNSCFYIKCNHKVTISESTFSNCTNSNCIGYINTGECKDQILIENNLYEYNSFTHFISIISKSDYFSFDSCMWASNELIQDENELTPSHCFYSECDISKLYFHGCQFSYNLNPILTIIPKVDIEISECYFEHNQKLLTNGGAISILGFSSTRQIQINILSSMFLSNQAAQKGGAISVSSQLQLQVNILNCQFSNNSATEGNAIYSNGCYISIDENCQFFKNINPQLSYRTQKSIIFQDSHYSLSNSNFNFGKIELKSTAEQSNYIQLIDNCTFTHKTDNEPDSNDFLINFDSLHDNVQYTNNTIIFDSSMAFGGIFIERINNCEIISSAFMNTYCISQPSAFYCKSVGTLFRLEFNIFHACYSGTNDLAQAIYVKVADGSAGDYEFGSNSIDDCGTNYLPYSIQLDNWPEMKFENNSIAFNDIEQTSGGLKVENCHNSCTVQRCNFTQCAIIDQIFLEDRKQLRGAAINIFGTTQPSIEIKQNAFERNVAFDGHALTIETKTFHELIHVTENVFADNFNQMRLGTLSAQITLGICEVAKTVISPANQFSITPTAVEVPEVIEIDESGCPLFSSFDSYYLQPSQYKISPMPETTLPATLQASTLICINFTGTSFTLYVSSQTDIEIEFCRFDETLQSQISATKKKVDNNGHSLYTITSPEYQYGCHYIAAKFCHHATCIGIKVTSVSYSNYINATSFDHTDGLLPTGPFDQTSLKLSGPLSTSLLTSQFAVISGYETNGVFEVSTDGQVAHEIQDSTIHTSYRTDQLDFQDHQIELTPRNGTSVIHGIQYSTFTAYVDVSPRYLTFQPSTAGRQASTGNKILTKGDSFEYTFYGTEFKIYGATPNGRLNISLDRELFDTCTPCGVDVLYDSTKSKKNIAFDRHTILVTNDNGEVEISLFSFLRTRPPIIMPTPTVIPPSSIYFSQSSQFSKSNDFSNSKGFSYSLSFTSSTRFTSSDIFSQTSAFSTSVLFSISNDFSKSNLFSESIKFSETTKFSQSNPFSESDLFLGTNQFTKSYLFSETSKFTQSTKFSQSIQFSDSAPFLPSNTFTSSNKFTSSYKFSNSNLFSQSTQFTQSTQFSQSTQFTQSAKFSQSNQFSDSDAFLPSKTFTSSNKFTKSNLFSQSSLFIETVSFSQSTQFSQSNIFSDSLEFTKSNAFLFSRLFSESSKFSQSTKFTISELFTGSVEFSPSEKHTRLFTKSESFTLSAQFSKSEEFSRSQIFTSSDPFTPTRKYINANAGNTHPGSASTGMIIGIVIALIVLAAIIIIFVIIFIKKKKRKDFDDQYGNEELDEENPFYLRDKAKSTKAILPVMLPTKMATRLKQQDLDYEYEYEEEEYEEEEYEEEDFEEA